MYRRILVPVDLDDQCSWSKAVPTAIVLADCFGARLTLATVVEEKVVSAPRWTTIACRQAVSTIAARLGSLAESLAGNAHIETRVCTGSICAGILEAAEEVDADLIILASHRPAMTDRILGANALGIVRRATCSVMVVRE